MPMQSIASPPGVPTAIDVRPGIVVMLATSGPSQNWVQVRLVRECIVRPDCWVIVPIGVPDPIERHAHAAELRTACPVCGTFAHGNIEDPNELRRCNEEVASTAHQEARAEWWERQQ